MAAIVMPRLNDAGDPGTVSEIFVGPGQAVERGTAVMAVEMSKAIVEIESTACGTVGAILVGVGDEVVVGQVLMEVG